MQKKHKAIEVRVVRGAQQVESLHLCHALVSDRAGRVLACFGEPDFPTFMRSSIKMLQAIPFAESEAVSRFGLDERCYALACASHRAEQRHLDAIQTWLSQLGLTEHDLECGAPHSHGKARAEPSPIRNTCSGKHCAMLSLARVEGWETKNYTEATHRVQQRVTQACADLLDYDLGATPSARDGCSIPTFCVPLRVLARGMARFGDPQDLSESRAVAVRALFRGMVSHPFYVAGSSQSCTLLMERGGGAFCVKMGAEGVYTAAVPSRGWGIALKCVDGANRAAERAIAALLESFALLDKGEGEEGSLSVKMLQNARGFSIGRIEARVP